MAVDATEQRQVEERFLEKLPERNNGHDVGSPAPDLLHRGVGVYVLRLYHDVAKAALLRILCERAWSQHLAAADRAVRLRHYSDNVERVLAQKRVETFSRRRGRTHEYNSHGCGLYHNSRIC